MLRDKARWFFVLGPTGEETPAFRARIAVQRRRRSGDGLSSRLRHQLSCSTRAVDPENKSCSARASK